MGSSSLDGMSAVGQLAPFQCTAENVGSRRNRPFADLVTVRATLHIDLWTTALSISNAAALTAGLALLRLNVSRSGLAIGNPKATVGSTSGTMRLAETKESLSEWAGTRRARRSTSGTIRWRCQPGRLDEDFSAQSSNRSCRRPSLLPFGYDYESSNPS